MGPSVSQLLDPIPQAQAFTKIRSSDDTGYPDEPSRPPLPPSTPPSRRRPGSRAKASISLDQRKRLLKKFLKGIGHLHANKIAHGDVGPSNLLLCIQPFSSQDVQAILMSSQNVDQSNVVRRIDGKQDMWAPRYLCIEQSLTAWCDMDQMIPAKLSDLGAAFAFNNPPTSDKCAIPTALRAPEIVLDAGIDHTIDIWSFGCLVYEILTGCRLFQVAGLNIIPRELQMIDFLGQPPPDIFARWPRRRRYFDENLQLIRSDVGSSEIAHGELHYGPTLETMFEELKPEDMSANEAAEVVGLLRIILRYEPSLRPSTAELLEHQWFRSIGD